MQTLLTLQDRDINPNAPEAGDRSEYRIRTAARAVVMDEDGQIPLLHAAARGYYKLPGGGVDEGEDLAIALERELLEELGCKAEVLGEIGIVEECRDYWKMKQTSHCFLARIVGDKGEPEFTESELADGFEVTWHKDVDAALEAIKNQTPTSDDMDIKYMQRRDIALLEAAKAIIG